MEVNENQNLAVETSETLRAAQGDGVAGLAGRELDKVIAEQVFGIKKIFRPCDLKNSDEYWSPSEYHYIPSEKPPRTHMIDALPIPYFSTDIAAAMEVENKIAELGLIDSYMEALEADIAVWYEADNKDKFNLVHATAEQRCRAALKAVENESIPQS